MDSIPDKILNRILVNERHVDNLRVILSVIKGTASGDKIKEIFSEYHYRSFNREFQFMYEKAIETLKTKSTLDEATKIIKG